MRLGRGVVDHGGAGRQRGRHQRVLGPHDRRLVHEEVTCAQAAGRRTIVHERSASSATTAPSARNASRCGSSRRRPITSPAGRRHLARPNRASSGPATGTTHGSARQYPVDLRASMLLGVGRRRRGPRATRPDAQALQQARASRPRRGSAARCARTTSSSVRSAGGQRGQRAVLVSGRHDRAGKRRPPSMTNFSMARLEGTRAVRPPVRDTRSSNLRRSLAAVTSTQLPMDAAQAWACSASGPSPTRCARTCWASRRRWSPTRASGARTRSRRPSRAPPRPRLRALPGPRDRPPRARAQLLEEHDYPQEIDRRDRRPRRPSWRAARDAAGEDAVRGGRAVRLHQACAYVRPTGIQGLTPNRSRRS